MSEDLCHFCMGSNLNPHFDNWSTLSDRELNGDYDRQNITLTNTHDGRFWYAEELTYRRQHRSKRVAALEVETCGVLRHRQRPINSVVNRWGATIGTDGSLPSTGFELRTAPAAGDFLVSQLIQLGNAMQAQNGFVTSQAGMHIHVDARDIDWMSMQRIIRLYARLEASLYLLASPSRIHNNYSRPCGKLFSERLSNALVPKDTKEAVYQTLYQHGLNRNEMRASRANHAASNRYYALNVHSWLYRGTLECRMFPGELRGSHMLGWAMLWTTLVDLGHSMTEKDIEAWLPGPAVIDVSRWTMTNLRSALDRLFHMLTLMPDAVRWFAITRLNEMQAAATQDHSTIEGSRPYNRNYGIVHPYAYNLDDNQETGNVKAVLTAHPKLWPATAKTYSIATRRAA
jgi:hypothetical protein